MATTANSTTAPSSRRGFLAGLASLPLIGGGVTLIGNPTAAAEPMTAALLDTYDSWLHFERRWLQFERTGAIAEVSDYPFTDRQGGRYDMISLMNPGGHYHGRETPPASGRAAIVLSAVGCGWTLRS